MKGENWEWEEVILMTGSRFKQEYLYEGLKNLLGVDDVDPDVLEKYLKADLDLIIAMVYRIERDYIR